MEHDVYPSIKRVAVLALLAGTLGPAHADELTFARTLDLAQQHSSALSAHQAAVRAAEYETRAAGQLPDPKLTVGIDNYPVSGPNRGSLEADFMTMRKLGLMQDVPTASKREAAREAAQAGVASAESSVRIARWRLRVAAAQAWLVQHHLERQIEQFAALQRLDASALELARASLAGGRGEAVDALDAAMEISRLDEQRDDLQRDLAKARAALRALIGDDASGDTTGVVSDLGGITASLGEQLERHPELRAYAAMQSLADADVHAARAAKDQDWSVELSYARRGQQFGDMVSVQFTLALPIFAADRQDPRIAASFEQRQRVDDERDALRRERRSELEADLADYERLQRQLERSAQSGLTLAEQRVDLTTAAFSAGKAPLARVIAARRELLEHHLRVITLESQRDVIAAKLHFTYVEDMP